MSATLSGRSHIDRVDNHAYVPYGCTFSCDCVQPKKLPKKNVTEGNPLDFGT